MASKGTHFGGEWHPLWPCNMAPSNRAEDLLVGLASLRSCAHLTMECAAPFQPQGLRYLKALQATKTACLPDVHPPTSMYHRYPQGWGMKGVCPRPEAVAGEKGSWNTWTVIGSLQLPLYLPYCLLQQIMHPHRGPQKTLSLRISKLLQGWGMSASLCLYPGSIGFSLCPYSHSSPAVYCGGS